MENNLKKMRENGGFTQQYCADYLSVSKATYCLYEQGKVSPSMETLIRLASLFECSVDYLLKHETRNIIHLDSLTAKQQIAIEMIKNLDDDALTLELGRLSQLTDTPIEIVLEQISKKGVE